MVRSLVGVCAIAAAACTRHVGDLQVELVRSSDPAQDPLGGTATLHLRVDGPRGRSGPVVFRVDQREGALAAVQAGDDQVVTVEGRGLAGNLVSVARSGPLRLAAGQQTLKLYLGLVGQFSNIAAPNGEPVPRAFHSATQLGDGTVVLAGGTSASYRPEAGQPTKALRSVEHVDGNGLTVSVPRCDAQQCLQSARLGHTATLLGTGDLLVAGGADADVPLASTELLEARARSVFAGPTLGEARRDHAAVVSGTQVIVAGGQGRSGTLSSVELYDQGQLTRYPQLLTARRAFALVRLASGDLVAAGGFDRNGQPTATTEVLRAGAPAWTAGPALEEARAHLSVTVLGDGGALLIGGLTGNGLASDLVERLAPDGGRVIRAGRLRQARWAHSATLLRDGRVLVVGGFAGSTSGSPLRQVEELAVGSESVFVRLGPLLNEARAGHAATLLHSGALLVSGGIGGSSIFPLRSAEVYLY